MSLYKATFDFASDVKNLNSRKGLETRFQKFLKPLGAQKFAAAFAGQDAAGDEIWRSISNLPVPWQQLYMERGYDEADPVFQSVARAGACGYWDELTRPVDMSQRAHEVMDYAGLAGMMDGYTKRTMLEHGGLAIVMIAGHNVDRSEEVRQALHWACDAFANQAIRMIKAPAAKIDLSGAFDLSPAQRKVLLMRERGMTNSEVALSTGVVRKTVESHVTQIIRRMKVRNMAEAIRRAKELNLLT